MYVSRAMLTGTVGVLMASAQAAASDAGRLDLLAAEAIKVVEPQTGTPTTVGFLLLAGLLLGTLLSAFLGTFFGIRSLAFGRVRERDGWREVAYRFRSEGPLTVGKDMVKRMGSVLDEIEDLGKKLKTVSTERSPAAQAPLKKDSTPRPTKEIKFARREEDLPRRSLPDPGPAASSGTRSTHAPPGGPAPPAPRPIARSTDGGGDRSARYRRARALLNEGHDRKTVRSMTGLKLAELDLLRCAPEPGVAA